VSEATIYYNDLVNLDDSYLEISLNYRTNDKRVIRKCDATKYKLTGRLHGLYGTFQNLYFMVFRLLFYLSNLFCIVFMYSFLIEISCGKFSWRSGCKLSFAYLILIQYTVAYTLHSFLETI